MGAAKRLRNNANLRGTPTEIQGGMTPRTQKRGLRGATQALWKLTTAVLNPHDATVAGNVPTVHTGQDNPDTGDVGVGVDDTDATLVARGSQYAYSGNPKVSTIPDKRFLLDSDPAPLGTDAENAALATFTAATGSGAAGTFEVTAQNTGVIYRVDVFEVGVDTDTDGDFIAAYYFTADGAADSIDLGAAYAGASVACYARETDGANNDPGTDDGISVGNIFATRRVATVHA